MKKDVVTKIDELIGFFVKPGSMARDPFQGLTGELSTLYSKVLAVARDGVKMKDAINTVIKQEGLNKNWAKKLKQYVKAYS